MSSQSMQPKRPGVVVLIDIYLWIVAAASLVVGIVLLIGSTNDEVLVEAGRTSTDLVIMGITEIVLGLIVVWVVMQLRNGSRGARTAVAVVMGLRIAATVFLVGWYHTGGYVLAGALHVILPAFVLWALYGTEKAEAFFEG